MRFWLKTDFVFNSSAIRQDFIAWVSGFSLMDLDCTFLNLRDVKKF